MDESCPKAGREEDWANLAEQFITAYPKPPSGRVTKKAVRSALESAIRRGAAFEDICASAVAYGAFERSEGREERYMQNAVTFLTHEMYLEKPVVPSKALAQAVKKIDTSSVGETLVEAVRERLGVRSTAESRSDNGGHAAKITCPKCGCTAEHGFGDVYLCPEHGYVTAAHLVGAR